jgi:hypothetical protein
MDLGFLGTDLLAVHPEAAIGTTFDVKVVINGVRTVLGFRVVPDAPEQPSQFMIISRGALKAINTEKRTRAEALQERDREWLIDRARRLDEFNARYYPVMERETVTSDPVSVRVRPTALAGRGPVEWLLVPIELTGRDPGTSHRFVSVEVWDSTSEKPLDTEVLLVGKEPPESDEQLTVLTAQDSARVVLSVKAETPGKIAPLRIVFRRAGGVPIVAKVPRWSLAPVEPLTPEEMQEIMREREERIAAAKRAQRDRELSKQTQIGVHGLYGAIWLDDGLPMTEDTDATSLAGGGVKVTKGVIPMNKGRTPMLAFEADLAIALSGTASFSDVVIDGMEGELQRSAKLVRVQIGGALRFGYPISAMVRLGVGGQGVSQDSELETAGGSVPVLDSSFEVTETLYVGGGVDLRFGRGFIAGLAMTLNNSGGRRSLEGSLHLTYGLGS